MELSSLLILSATASVGLLKVVALTYGVLLILHSFRKTN